MKSTYNQQQEFEMGKFQTVVTIYDGEGEPIDGALVDVTNADYGGKTDRNGEFEFIAASKDVLYRIKATRYGRTEYAEVYGGRTVSLRFD